MYASRIVLPLVILVTGVAGFFALGKKPDEKTEKPQGLAVPEVKVVQVDRHEGTLDIGVDGQAVPYREIKLSAEVAGRIVYKAEAARAGRFAKKDTVLLRIDDHDYAIMVQQLETELEQADVSVLELDEEIAGSQRLVDLAQTQVKLAEKDHQRHIDLFERGASTDAEMDKSNLERINAEHSLTTVGNQVTLLKTRRSRVVQSQTLTELKKKKAKYDLERTSIEAPVNGVIVMDTVEQGDYVTNGTHLLTIEDTTVVEVKCNLRMDELHWVWDQATAGNSNIGIRDHGEDYQLPPTRATVVYRLEGREYTWDGDLWRIDGVGVDEKTRTVPCRVIVRSPQSVWVVRDGERRRATGGPPALVRGMYVDVIIHTKPSQPLLQVPQQAIRPGEKVWLARPLTSDEKKAATDEKKAATDKAAPATHALEIVQVDVIESTGDRAIVRSDARELSAGDVVVVSPLALPIVTPGDEEDSPPMLLRLKRDGTR